MESKLGLNLELVEKARASAKRVADDTQSFIDQHTTVTVERAVCRLLGIDGVNEMDVPMPNVLVDHLLAVGVLPMGAAWTIGNAMLETGLDPQGVAEAIDKGELDLSKVPAHDDKAVREAVAPYVKATIERINKNVSGRNEFLKEFGDKEGAYLYVIVATGNIYEDITQAKAAAKHLTQDSPHSGSYLAQRSNSAEAEKTSLIRVSRVGAPGGLGHPQTRGHWTRLTPGLPPQQP